MAKKRPSPAATSGSKANSANIVSQDQSTSDSTVASAAQAAQEEPAAVATIKQEQAKPVLHATFPAWPSSRQGPQSTPPPPGMRSINPLRPEQVAEIGYNQETGEPSTQSPFRSLPDENVGSVSFDTETAQEALNRHKKERI